MSSPSGSAPVETHVYPVFSCRSAGGPGQSERQPLSIRGASWSLGMIVRDFLRDYVSS